MYTSSNVIPQNPSYFVLPPQNPPYRQNRFQYEQYSTPQPNPIVPPLQNSHLPENFQQKLDYLNQKLDQQLKLSAEIGAKAQSPNIYPRFNGGYPFTSNEINGVRTTYTPERFISSKNMNSPVRDTYVTMPKNISPQIKAKILEEEIKLSVNNSIRNNQNQNMNNDDVNYETTKKATPSPNNRNNEDRNERKSIGLREKIQTIQENLGIDVEAILDKIYDVAEKSPHNPLKKLQEKKKSRMTTPEKRSKDEIFQVETMKKIGYKENIFQTPQKSSDGIEEYEKNQENPIQNYSLSSRKSQTKEENKEEVLFEIQEDLKSNKEEKSLRNAKESLKHEEKRSLKQEEKQSLKFSMKEDLRPDLISKEKKDKGLMAEIKMDVAKVLEWMYEKVLIEAREIDNKETIIKKSLKKDKCLMVEIKMDVAKGLEWMYEKVLNEVKEIDKKETIVNDQIVYEKIVKSELESLYTGLFNNDEAL